MASRKFRVQPTRNKALLLQDARGLFDTFVSAEAKKQINLSGTERQTLHRAVEHGCVTKLTFEEAELEIWRLMDMDSFSRFRFSDVFTVCLESCRSEQVGVKKGSIRRRPLEGKGQLPRMSEAAKCMPCS